MHGAALVSSLHGMCIPAAFTHSVERRSEQALQQAHTLAAIYPPLHRTAVQQLLLDACMNKNWRLGFICMLLQMAMHVEVVDYGALLTVDGFWHLLTVSRRVHTQSARKRWLQETATQLPAALLSGRGVA